MARVALKIGWGVIRLELNDLIQIRDRSGHFPRLQVGHRPLVVSVGILGLESNGLVVVSEREVRVFIAGPGRSNLVDPTAEPFEGDSHGSPFLLWASHVNGSVTAIKGRQPR